MSMTTWLEKPTCILYYSKGVTKEQWPKSIENLLFIFCLIRIHFPLNQIPIGLEKATCILYNSKEQQRNTSLGMLKITFPSCFDQFGTISETIAPIKPNNAPEEPTETLFSMNKDERRLPPIPDKKQTHATLPSILGNKQEVSKLFEITYP